MKKSILFVIAILLLTASFGLAQPKPLDSKAVVKKKVLDNGPGPNGSSKHMARAHKGVAKPILIR